MSDNSDTTSRDLADQFRRGFPKNLPDKWGHTEPVIAAHRQLAQEFIAQMPPCSDGFHGRGIVVCAGGNRLFANAWVCLQMLRHVGCQLPAQLWYLGESELDPTMRNLVAGLGVECVDAEQVAGVFPARILNGWEIKPFAILHSPFEEVLLLDADNIALRDPTFLFETPQYQQHGAVFWPDYGRLAQSRLIWSICEIDYRDEPEFESGQVLVHKRKCWRALQLTMHYNEHSDFYFHHIHGDKETFHMAFRRLGQQYAMPTKGIFSLESTMCQHDFQGERLFQHRNLDKWRFDGSNKKIRGFQAEETCREFLADLRRQWGGRAWWNEMPTEFEQRVIKECSEVEYDYVRVGHDRRRMRLRPDRTIGKGSASNERAWTITALEGNLSLVIFGEDRPTCRLVPRRNGCWDGRWYRHERMPIQLERVQAD